MLNLNIIDGSELSCTFIFTKKWLVGVHASKELEASELCLWSQCPNRSKETGDTAMTGAFEPHRMSFLEPEVLWLFRVCTGDQDFKV